MSALQQTVVALLAAVSAFGTGVLVAVPWWFAMAFLAWDLAHAQSAPAVLLALVASVGGVVGWVLLTSWLLRGILELLRRRDLVHLRAGAAGAVLGTVATLAAELIRQFQAAPEAGGTVSLLWLAPLAAFLGSLVVRAVFLRREAAARA